MKKKTIAIFVSSAVLTVAVFSFASAATNGQPFNALQDSLNKLQAQIDELSADFSNSNSTSGVHRKVYSGTLPNSIPSTMGDDDMKTEREVAMGDATYQQIDYYKIVAISEINTKSMPQVGFFLKNNDEAYAGLGENTWLPSSGDLFFIKDGAVYLRYASDFAGNPYTNGVQMYPEMAGRDYNIVVIN